MKEIEAYPRTLTYVEETSFSDVVAIEKTKWVEKVHPTRSSDPNNRLFDPGNNESLYYWKKENDYNEPFVELLANQLANSLHGLHVAPTFVATFKGDIGISSEATVTTSCLLDVNNYQSFQDWEGSSFVSRHVVFNFWIANNDWGMDRYDNSYIVSKDSAGNFLSAYGIDFGHSLFCPPNFYQGNFGDPAVEFLSNNFVYSSSGCLTENNFFGVQIFLKHSSEGLETLSEIEAKDNSSIVNICQSVAQFLGRAFPNRKMYYASLAESSARVLIARKVKLREWIQKQILLPNKHLLGV